MGHHVLARIGFALLLLQGVGARAQAVLAIAPPGRTNVSQKSQQVTLTLTPAGTVFAAANLPKLKIESDPPNMITAAIFQAVPGSANAVTANLTLANNAWGTVDITLVGADGTKYGPAPFDTGVYCIDATAISDCALRFEVDTSSASGSSSQTNKDTAPNIMFKLDYLLAKNKDSETKDAGTVSHGAHGAADRFNLHLTLDMGYTQTTAATKLQPVTNSGSVPASGSASSSGSTPCTGTSSSSSTSASATPSTCTAATPQQAFVATGGGTMGWTFSQDGQGTFAELGFAARGSFQDLVQSNQVVQSGGSSYINLSSNNPRNAIGLYEGVARFRVAALGHDAPAAAPKKTGGTSTKIPARTNSGAAGGSTTPKTGSEKSTYSHNSSDFLVMEAGYQNNSGLAQLAANPQTNTRNRFVGRIYLYPPLPGATQTKPMIGMEYSGGIAGGPKVVQIFFGVNLNPSKLVQNNSPNPKAAAAPGN